MVKHSSGRSLGQVQIDAKHNETSHFQEALSDLDLKPAAGPGGGEQVTVVTFDALHTVRADLDWLATEQVVHYVSLSSFLLVSQWFWLRFGSVGRCDAVRVGVDRGSPVDEGGPSVSPCPKPRCR
ncbi:hypothetical protein Kisp01_67550 [Kineosporia sp. NBRC 101677]|nr:hypothetical protein Kisp01_67550 [Kineosporia sp. NBRC 101677]